MFKKLVWANLLILAGLNFSIAAQDKIIVHDANARKMLLGKHLLSLQWISWDYFGTATVTNKDGVFYLKGQQKSRNSTDFVKVDGTITEIDKTGFKFDGTIIMQISHINDGEPCERTGEMTFAIIGKRKYWRLQEMKSPCDVTTDYIDIYLRK